MRSEPLFHHEFRLFEKVGSLRGSFLFVCKMGMDHVHLLGHTMVETTERDS